MKDFDQLFRRRIGFPEGEAITFENLDTVLELTATSIPFDNLCTLAGELGEINQETLVEKIIGRNEGGLCYDLNSILYLFLQESGFDVRLVRGAVYVPELGEFSPTGSTHAAILLTHAGQEFLVDTGFGGNLPLKPVPMDGQEIRSFNGEFRVIQEESEFGDHYLEMKLRNKDTGWRKGYAFDTRRTVSDVREFIEMKRIITEHPGSPFNKKPLLTRVTPEGTMVLTDTSFTYWQDGQMVKEEIDAAKYRQLAMEHFKREIR